MSVSVLVTGASGMLGRMVTERLREEKDLSVIGWSHSRIGPNLVSVDLKDPEAVRAAFQAANPSVIVHCAAERKPDSISLDPSGAATLNAAATGLLASLLAESSCPKPLFIYISTDYVFDGTSPPYKEEATPNPINQYGILKLEGEKKTEQRSRDKSWSILRVPILYGPVERVGEGAVDALLPLLVHPEKEGLVDNVQRRYPTHTADVAQALQFLIRQHVTRPGSVSGIFHFSGLEETRKFEMVKDMGAALGKSTTHIKPNDAEPAVTEASVRRPKDAQLQNNRLIELGCHFKPKAFKDQIQNLYSSFLS